MRLRRKWSRSVLTAQLVAIGLVGAGMATCRGDEEPPPPISLEQRVPKVLLIGVDGVRPDVLDDVATPNLDALAAGGWYTARTRTTTPSMSGPGWSSMLTGVWPEKHGVTNNDFTGRSYDDYPDFLTRIERERPELTTVAIVDWLPLMDIDGGSPTLSEQIDTRIPVDGYALGWAVADTEVAATGVRYLSESDTDVMFVYLGNPDETSHEHGSIGTEYREAIALADQHVGALVAAVRGRPTYPSENWLVLVSTDHGRRADGGHGGASPVEMTTFILTSGPASAIGSGADDTFIVDVAVTALTHLGITLDAAWDLDGRAVGLR
jgi:type I phosphodiesterase/nucleotide pyrophosphatase